MDGKDLQDLRDLASRYAWAFAKTWYAWGGDDPSGLDCSGFCVEVLQGVGLLPHRADADAQALHDRFPKVTIPSRGCLAFWGRDARQVTHVGFVAEVIGDRAYCLEASGGGPSTRSVASAIQANAFVKLRPVLGSGARTDFVGYCDPFDGERR